MIYAILIAYIAIVFLGSLRGSAEKAITPEGYFLANRDLGTLTLFFYHFGNQF